MINLQSLPLGSTQSISARSYAGISVGDSRRPWSDVSENWVANALTARTVASTVHREQKTMLSR